MYIPPFPGLSIINEKSQEMEKGRFIILVAINFDVSSLVLIFLIFIDHIFILYACKSIFDAVF